VAVLYAALTVVFAYPLSVRPGSMALPGDPDTNLYMWTLAWDTWALTHQPWAVFDSNIYFPERLTLAFSENLIGSVPFAAPALWLTGNHVLALNSVALASVVLCGVGAWVLARRVGIGQSGAVLAGLVFAFSPPRFFRFGQLHLTTVQWIPFGLACLHKYLDGGGGKYLRLTALFFTLQALATGHGAVFFLVGALTLVGWRVARGEPLALRRRIRDLGATGLVTLLPAALVVVPYRQVQVEQGLRRSLEDWAVNPQSFLASPGWLDSTIIASIWGPWVLETAHALLFPGFLVLLLAATAAVWLPREATRRDATIVFALMGLLSLSLAIGPPLSLWPYVYWLPGMNFIRAPSRFTILTLLCLAVLAGLGFERLTSRLTAVRRRAVALGAGALLVAEFVAVPLPAVPYSVEIPEADRWLADQARPFVVAEFPSGLSDRLHSTYMLHATAHWERTVSGHSGLRTRLHQDLYWHFEHFPDEDSIARMADLKVDYIVIHPHLYPPGEWDEVRARLDAFRDRLEPVFASDTGEVYRLSTGPR